MTSPFKPPQPGKDRTPSAANSDDVVFTDEDEQAPASGAPASGPIPAPAKSAGFHPFFGTVPAADRGAHYVFAPVWDGYHKILSTYFCMPAGPLPSGLTGLGHELLARGARDVERAEFDRKSFEFVAQTASAFQREKTAVLMSFALDYVSLSSPKSRDHLLGAFRALAQPLGTTVSVRIVNAPEDAAPATLAERVALVRPFFRAVTLQIHHLDQDVGRFAYMGLHGLTMRLNTERAATPDYAQIAQAVRKAKAAKLHFALDAVPDLSCAKHLVQAGATYLSGPFLGGVHERPAPPRRCALEDFG